MINSNELNDLNRIRSMGFEGFITVAQLRKEGLERVPSKSGVYLVIRTSIASPIFLKHGTGGFFKRNDPNVSISKLRQEWVEGALVLYIGQTGTLNRRIGELIEFGEGKPIGHYGGRLLWQLSDADSLKVCWRSLEGSAPDIVKRELIKQFKTFHQGKRPFANLRG